MTINPNSYYTLLQAYALPGLYGVNPSLIQRVSPTQVGAVAFNQAAQADQVQISTLAQLTSAVTTFQTTAQGLEQPSQVAPAQVGTTNSAIGTATALTTALPGTYNVTVSALAQAQTASSIAFADPNNSVIGSGTLTFQLGTYNAGANSFTAGSTPAVQISVTNGSLNSIASAINNANAGVAATVVQDQNGYHLALTSTSTGAAYGFKVTAQDQNGNPLTSMTGLGQLAYDPTAAAGSGKNLTLAQAAQNASLTVNGVAQTSASNTGVTIAQGVTFNLAQAGSTTVSVTQNTSALQSAAQSLVTAFNSLVGTLNNDTAAGGPLATDPVAAQLKNALTNGLLGSFAGDGIVTSLQQIGISGQQDGTFTLDPNLLQSSFNSDPAGTIAVLNQAAQAFDTLANNYAGPGGSIPSESDALQQDMVNLQTVGGATQSAGAYAQSQAAAGYQAALQLGYQNQLTASEVANLANLQQLQPFGSPQPFGGTQSVGLPLSNGVIA